MSTENGGRVVFCSEVLRARPEHIRQFAAGNNDIYYT